GRLTLGGRYTIDKRRVAGHIAAGTVELPRLRETWKEPTWRVVYDHRITDDAMIYASYNRGFKSGNFNIIPATTPPYSPEIVDSFEIGTKSDWLDNRVRLNIAAFYSKYK